MNALRRETLFMVVAAVLVASTAYALLAAEDDAPYGDVSVEQAWGLIRSKPNLVVLDVRTVAEYDEGHISGALNIPVQELEERLGELDSSAEYLVYCRTGNRSSVAVQLMKAAGFDRVYHMSMGITAWVGAGHPVVG
ncbi:MAG: rhodanese-like domain-containing protein [Candidatus Bathyarchaeota archaeon]